MSHDAVAPEAVTDNTVPMGRVGCGRQTVVQIAYACRPAAGSESGAGWAWALAASRFSDVILLLGMPAERDDVEKVVAELNLAITPQAVSLPGWLEQVLAAGRPGTFARQALGSLRYCIWQFAAARALIRLEGRQQVDVVHHITFASDSFPTALTASRAPVRIWGPVGGATRMPLPLYRYLGARGALEELARVVATAVSRAIFGNVAARRATLVLALNGDVEHRFRRRARRIEIESNIGLHKDELRSDAVVASSTGSSNTCTAIFAGRLLPWKGLRLAVEALRYAPEWRLVIYGDGPDRHAIERVGRSFGLEERVEVRGNVSREVVLAAMQSADAFLFPSFHDAASTAVAEASALGCPVVCLDLGGPRLQAGVNAHVVTVSPNRTLAKRLGLTLAALKGRGVEDAHLSSDRIEGNLRKWYSEAERTTARP